MMNFDEHFNQDDAQQAFRDVIGAATEKPAQFERYFSLEEAVALLPFVNANLVQAHEELRTLQDDIILYKRMHAIKEEEGYSDDLPEGRQIRTILKEKWNRFDEGFHRWDAVFAQQGIIVRSMQKGIIDFPYRSKKLGEDFFLCWHYPEEGIFYFHATDEGFGSRKPITLLPE